MSKSELYHLNAVIKFLNAKKLLNALQTKNWQLLAYRYNGPMYMQNQYDIKLERAYKENIKLNDLNY